MTELDCVTPVAGCSWALIPLRQATTQSEAARATYKIFLEPKMEQTPLASECYQVPGTSPCVNQFSMSFTISSSLIFTSLRPFSAEVSVTWPE